MAAKFATDTTAGPTQNPLWQHALSTYASAGMESRLLKLQDEHGIDILWVLTALWLADEGIEMTADDRRQPDYEDWCAQMIRPLRAQRRACDKVDHPSLYSVLKQAELEAERVGLDKLYAAFRDRLDQGDADATSSSTQSTSQNGRELSGRANLVLCSLTTEQATELLACLNG